MNPQRPPTNGELAKRLRIIASSTANEKVKHVLEVAANRLDKDGHKQYNVRGQKVTFLYTVWDNRTDQIVAVDLPEKDCLEIMKISHNGFYKVLRGFSNRWKIEKKFAEEIEE